MVSVRVGKAERRKPMMHDFKKSESPIIAMNATNNPGQTGAESPERRGDTKGNVSTISTRRTQSRESVSPGLARIRQQAKAQAKLRFTALLHHVSVDLLRQSYLALKRKAAARVDGVTWSAYGDGLEEHLLDLHGATSPRTCLSALTQKLSDEPTSSVSFQTKLQSSDSSAR